MKKKGITPVVATALLLVVVVVAVVGFQTWFNSYSSGLFTKIDQQSSSNSLSVKGLIGNVLYLQSGSNTNLTSLSVENYAGKTMCSFSGLTNVSSQGLVGWWKFNSDSSTIKDYSGNGNNGKLYGDTRLLMNFDNVTGTNVPDATAYQNNGTIVGGVNCNVKGINGNGCEFDGSSGYIDNLPNIYSSNFSYSLWVKVNENKTVQALIVQRSITNGLPLIETQINPDRRVSFQMRDNSNSNYLNLLSSSKILDNEWNYLTFVKSGTNISIYIDGKFSNSSNYYGTNWSLANKTYLGRDPYDGVRWFNGSIDEVGIYSTALTSSQIQDLYNSQKAKFIEFQKSNLDQAVSFDGVDDYVQVPNNNFDIYNNYSVFVLGKDLGMSGTILRIREYGYALGYVNNLWGYTSTFDPNSTASQYVRTYYNISSKGQAFSYIFAINSTNFFSYYNNNFKTVPIYQGGYYAPDGSGLIFGKDGITNNAYYNGTLDEVRIYNRTLSPSEIKKLYWYSIRPLQIGINPIDLSSCNLVKGNSYDIVGFTNNAQVDLTTIAK